MLRTAALTLFLTCTASYAADVTSVVRLSEPVDTTDSHEIFGRSMDGLDGAMRLGELIQRQDEYLGKEVLITARVAKVCQKKGCFFVAQDGEYVARVTFADYAFFVPTDSGGKEVTFAGTLSRKTLTAKAARHYAEDAGELPPPNLAPQPEYAILASAVAMPRS